MVSATGKGAIELCRREKPAVLVLDIMLPDTDGIEICRKIRSHPDLAHLPVIFLTARASEGDKILGLELGANDYMVKPFSVRELIARIRNQLRGQPSPERVLRADGIELDRDSCRVRLHGKALQQHCGLFCATVKVAAALCRRNTRSRQSTTSARPCGSSCCSESVCIASDSAP